MWICSTNPNPNFNFTFSWGKFAEFKIHITLFFSYHFFIQALLSKSTYYPFVRVPSTALLTNSNMKDVFSVSIQYKGIRSRLLLNLRINAKTSHTKNKKINFSKNFTFVSILYSSFPVVGSRSLTSGLVENLWEEKCIKTGEFCSLKPLSRHLELCWAHWNCLM